MKHSLKDRLISIFLDTITMPVRQIERWIQGYRFRLRWWPRCENCGSHKLWRYDNWDKRTTTDTHEIIHMGYVGYCRTCNTKQIVETAQWRKRLKK
jgi:hypothetical protein